MKNQLADEGLREDLMESDELRAQSEELLEELLNKITETNLENVRSAEFGTVADILSGISRSRARQGFSPRETGGYIFLPTTNWNNSPISPATTCRSRSARSGSLPTCCN